MVIEKHKTLLYVLHWKRKKNWSTYSTWKDQSIENIKYHVIYEKCLQKTEECQKYQKRKLQTSIDIINHFPFHKRLCKHEYTKLDT
jgi:hypothetical protein